MYGASLYYPDRSMVGDVTQIADRAAQPAPWSPREAELLEVTLRLLQDHGYDGLTVPWAALTS
jgi:hypothetical protein